MSSVLLALAALALGAAGVSLDPIELALAPPLELFDHGGMPADGRALIPLPVAKSGAFFGDGTLLSSSGDNIHHYAGDLSVRHSSLGVQIGHMVPHPDGSIVALEYNTDTIFKFTASGGVLTQAASSSDAAFCDGPSRAVVQRTGNQRVFVSCFHTPESVCQFDADLGNRACTAVASIRSMAIAPDDGFIVVRGGNTLQKYAINDGAGTLTAGATFDMSASTPVAGGYGFAILADLRIVFVDQSNDQLEVMNAAFSAVTTIDVNSVSLGGITPGCSSPMDVAVDQAGAGDVFVVCDGSNTLLILSNDLATTALELVPDDLGLIGNSFTFGSAVSAAMLNVAATTKMYVGGNGHHGFAILDLTGAGSSGLAGSYASPLLAPPKSLAGTAVYGATVPLIGGTGGVGVFADGTVLMSRRGDGTLTLFSSDLLTMLDAKVGLGQPHDVTPHPDGSMIVLDSGTETILKYTSSGGSLALAASSSDAAFCNGPSRAAVQRTGNQRVFVSCIHTPDAVCQYDADLSNRACTAVVDMRGVAMAPDDSFIVVRDGDTLKKYTVNDGAGTLTAGATLDISGTTTANVYSMAILSDLRIVLPDRGQHDIVVVNSTFSGATTTAVNGSPLGGITPSCLNPTTVSVDQDGAGDLFVGCDGTDSLLILSNDLTTTALEPDLPVGYTFSATTGSMKPFVAVADASGTRMAILSGKGFQLLDLTGAGSSGLAGSYASPVASIVDLVNQGILLDHGAARYPFINSVVGVVDFPDGTLGVSMAGGTDSILLMSADFLTQHDSYFLDVEPKFSVRHPDGTAIVVVDSVTLHSNLVKLSASGNSLVLVGTYSDSACRGTFQAVVQQTGNQRIFVPCVDTDQLCQFDADLSNPSCTSMAFMQGVGISPDSTYLVVRSSDTLRKFTINDGAGTLTETASFSVAGSATTYDYYYGTFGVYGHVVLSDGRIVFADRQNDEIQVVNAAFDAVSTLSVTSGTLGGITPDCRSPDEVAVDATGTSEVLVVCEDRLLVLSNDLSTSAFELGVGGLNIPYSPSFGPSSTSRIGFLSNGELYIGGEGLLRITGTTVPGAVGDPVMVDFRGHRFLGGSLAEREYRLLHYGRDTVTVTTGKAFGREGDYFVVATTLERRGCGTVRLEPVPGQYAMTVGGDECARMAIATGDNGLVVFSVDNGAAVIAVKPHVVNTEFSFLNTKFVFVSEELRRGCVEGMLCSEEHREDLMVRV